MEVDPSESRDSVKPILRWSERNEEDTDWTRVDGTKPSSAKNKLKSEVMATIRKRKDLMCTEVAKNDQDSLVDRWLWDQIKPDTWDKIVQVFPQQGKCSPQRREHTQSKYSRSVTETSDHVCWKNRYVCCRRSHRTAPRPTLFPLSSGRLSNLSHKSTRILQNERFLLLSERTFHLSSSNNCFIGERVFR
jgi:hypothetical protein